MILWICPSSTQLSQLHQVWAQVARAHLKLLVGPFEKSAHHVEGRPDGLQALQPVEVLGGEGGEVPCAYRILHLCLCPCKSETFRVSRTRCAQAAAHGKSMDCSGAHTFLSSLTRYAPLLRTASSPAWSVPAQLYNVACMTHADGHAEHVVPSRLTSMVVVQCGRGEIVTCTRTWQRKIFRITCRCGRCSQTSRILIQQHFSGLHAANKPVAPTRFTNL